jgi:hypothetical protein
VDVRGEQAFKNDGLGSEGLQNPWTEARKAIEHQHQLSHQRRTTRQAPMGRLILIQVVRGQGVS